MNAAKQAFVHTGGPTEEALWDYAAGRLHPQAGEWIANHVTSCSRCTAAVEQIGALREALEVPEVSPFQRQRDVTAVRRRLEAPRRFGGRPVWVLSGALGLAAAALVVWVGMKKPAPPVQVALGQPVPWSVLAREGAADVQVGDDHAVVQANLSLPSGSLLVVQPESRVIARWGAARVVVDGGRAGARVRLDQSRTESRRLSVERGKVVLDVDPLAPGQTLAVRTDDEEVTVHGTIFLVDKSAEGTTVAVDRGRVRVASRNRNVDVDAGLRLSPGASAVSALETDDRTALGLVSGLPAADVVTESLDVFADVTGAEVAVDGVPHGKAPLSLAVVPGVHRVRVTASGRLPVEERVEVVAGSPTLFRAELNPLKAAFEDTHVEKAHAGRPAAPAKAESGDVLTLARADMMAGNYPKAIARLEATRQKPASPTQGARATLLEAQAFRLAMRPERAVPLLEQLAKGDGAEAEQGTLQLAQTLGRDLGDPRRAAVVWAGAQRRFPKGVFREEIAFRLGESLIAAGEPREGVEALERFLTSFPRAAHTDDAHLLVAAARRDRLSDCTGAIPHLRAVAAGGLTNPRAELALVGAARCLLQVGRVDEARSAYARYLAELPRGRFADEAREKSAARTDRHK